MTDDTPDWKPHINPGAHITPPVSHTPWEPAESLAALLERVIELRLVRRHYWEDALWPRYRANLRQFRLRLLTEIEHEHGEHDYDQAELKSLLEDVKFYLGELG
jgi:uncharacterized membrane protein YccC